MAFRRSAEGGRGGRASVLGPKSQFHPPDWRSPGGAGRKGAREKGGRGLDRQSGCLGRETINASSTLGVCGRRRTETKGENRRGRFDQRRSIGETEGRRQQMRAWLRAVVGAEKGNRVGNGYQLAGSDLVM